MPISRRQFAVLGGGVAAGLATGGLGAGPAAAAAPPEGHGKPSEDHGKPPHTVTFDRHSLLVDGRRTPVWSGEFHPFRLPAPRLWRDVLQKLRAAGLNTVSVYVAWNYHSPAPGRHDFTGVRDLGAVLDTAAETGLFVTVRPGPYINAEVDGGGFPGWLIATPGRARSDDPGYLAHVDAWLTAVNAVVAPRQYTRGGGTVLLYQLENEYSSHLTDGIGAAYLAHLYAKVRADGIDVPLFHNDKGHPGDWTPGSFPTGGEEGRYLYAFDAYPDPAKTPPDYGWYGPGGPHGGSTASPGTPGFIGEFGGGWFDCWGGAEFDGRGYPGARASRDAAYERRSALTNLANGITLQNIYMTFGGTSWGWLPAPIVYTSYDYGAAVDEARNLTAKVPALRQFGELLTAVPDLARLDRAADTAADDPAVKVYHLANPETGAQFYVVRNDDDSDRRFTLPVTTAAGPLTVPAAERIRLHGRDAKLLATDLPLGTRRLRYTTAQPMIQETVARQDLAVLVARPGDPVELGIVCPEPPTVTVLAGAATSAHDPAAGLLRINATVRGLTRIRLTGGGSATPLLLLLADDEATATLWRHPTDTGTVLVRGPALLRTARLHGDAARLTGDTTEECELEVWAPGAVERLRWNGREIPATLTPSGSLLAHGRLPGPAPVRLPELTGWRRRAENPEAAPDFDDSDWPPADLRTSASSTPVPAGQPVLFSDDYGFHYGDVWYRAAFSGPTGGTLALAYQTGTQGLLMAWLDGTPLGTHRMPVPARNQASKASWTATATLPLPDTGEGDHRLAVLVRPMAHAEDGGSNDSHKAARGLLSAALTPAGGAPAPELTWRLRGGDPTADEERGPLNSGGLYGEREGWHLPDHDGDDWEPVSLPYTETRQGVAWYRTTFRLDLDRGLDASLGLTLTDDPGRAYRAQLFVNGWNMGQYINDVGPQHTFVLPEGVLHHRGRNTLALAVLTDGTGPAGPGTVALTLLGLAAGGTT
ncbi:beta-galactosidase [Kitasatospora sp. NPDC089509]|uniref:glycoside hydrolase family 35 protein n=1 Tax=Kitasatospora sp. NPDC089509 TaxID=3364079 RepID=UPI00380D1886